MLISKPDLAARAGVDPWTLRDDLAAGDPGQISTMANGWARAGGDAELATNTATDASQRTAGAFLVDGAPGHNADRAVRDTSTKLGLGGAEMVHIGRLLDSVSDGLAHGIGETGRLVAELDGHLDRLQSEYDNVGGNAPGASVAQAGATERFIEAMVQTVRNAGGPVQAAVTAYTDLLSQGLTSLAGIGVTPADLAGAGIDGSDSPLAASVPPPPAGGDPQANKQWWEGLSQEQRDAVLAERPELVGNLDGISAAERDIANRSLLDDQRELLERQRDDATTDEERYLAQDRLNGLGAISDRLNQSTDPADPQRPYLLGLDQAGNGRAILSIGNPDTAANVATIVPGTNSRLGDIGGGIGNADRLADAAGPGTATIIWHGYDAPQSISGAAMGGSAVAGAPLLDRFQDGLRVTHEGERSHNTVIGHSYGGVTVGQAARTGGLDVDEMVFAASPGSSAGSLGDPYTSDGLGIPTDRVWATVAPDDWIDNLPEGAHGVDPHSNGNGVAGDFGANTRIAPAGSESPHSSYFHGENVEWLGGIVNGTAPRVDS